MCGLWDGVRWGVGCGVGCGVGWGWGGASSRSEVQVERAYIIVRASFVPDLRKRASPAVRDIRKGGLAFTCLFHARAQQCSAMQHAVHVCKVIRGM